MLPEIEYKNFEVNAQTFCHLVKIGSFSGVAKHFSIDQSTVSRRISSLEKDLQVILVKRNTRKMELTEDGNKFYNLYLIQISNLKKIINAFQLKTDNRVTINLSIPMGIAAQIISPKIALFLEQHPSISINIFYQNREVDLIKENIDLAILRHIPNQQTTKIRKLFSGYVQLYATPEYIKQYGNPQSLDELNNHNVVNILTDDGNKYLVEVIDEEHNNKNLDFEYTPRLCINNVDHAFKIASYNNLMIPGFDLTYKDKLLNGQLIKVLPAYRFSKVELFLARVIVDQHPALEELITFIEQCFI